LKADGAMRDALSIFDQVASFTGGNITYQGVIENLNVLDYEYYFRLTDYFLENKVSEILLLFNDVLNNGFDGGHFITGLSSHFRDVLVSKDPVTLPLLEVGASIREHYRTQAQKCPLPFLYRAMKLCNDCDINYRAAKNKRLLIELTLIQIAQITVSGETDTSSGRSPKQEIKPIFTQPAPAAGEHLQAPAAPDTTVPTSSILTPKAMEERTLPLIKGANRGFSIKQAQASPADKTPAPTGATSQPETLLEENQLFDEKKLNFYWQEYAAKMPLEQKAIAMRMQNIRATLLNETTFEVLIDNEIIAKEFIALIPQLQNHLRVHLKNRDVKMTVRVSEHTENTRPASRTEKYQLMAKKNNALITLKEEFGLEFS
jgi:DNA polymerase-3 subunit gamma/tau